MGLKSLFIKTPVEEEKRKVNDVQEVHPQLTPVPYELRPQTQPVATNEDFSVFMGQLQEVLEESNLPNVQDYMDLKKALENMQGMNMDEATKYKAVFATLQAAGCDLNALIESFNFYKNILEGEKQKFDEALSSTTSEAVLEKQKRIEELVRQNEEKSETIRKLNAEINSNQEQVSSMQVEVSSANAKIEQKKYNFAAAYQQVFNEIESDERKVKMYIGTIDKQQKTKKFGTKK